MAPHTDRSVAPFIAGMCAFGLVALGSVGALMQSRMGDPVAERVRPIGTSGDSGRAVAAPVRRAGGLAALADGTARALESAHEALRLDARTEAVHALDAAMRASDVGRHATAGQQTPFAQAFRTVHEARRNLQNGRTPFLESLSQAAADLRDFDAGPTPLPQDLAAYEGATLLDVQGVRVGELESARGGEAVLRVGGLRDFMGLIDLGGERRTVPLSSLVFGEARTIGTTAVVATAAPPL